MVPHGPWHACVLILYLDLSLVIYKLTLTLAGDFLII